MECFHSFVHTLLKEPAERELFFKVRSFTIVLICSHVAAESFSIFSTVFVLFKNLASNCEFNSLAWQEDFLVEYGPKFDQELEKLLWEFLLRLDRLLPIPSLSQVVCTFDFY